MSWSLLASTTQAAVGGTDFTTAAINTTGADLIVVGFSIALTGNFSVATISDSYGNTWTLAKAQPHFNSPSDIGNKLYYCQNPTVGASHTFSASGGGYASLCVVAWSGSASSPLDVTSQSPPSWGPDFDIDDVTPTADNELCITYCSDVASTPPIINESYTVDLYTVNIGSNCVGGAIAHLVQTTATATGPIWSSGGTSAASFASFKMAAGGPAPVTGTLTATEAADVAAINGSVTNALVAPPLMTRGRGMRGRKPWLWNHVVPSATAALDATGTLDATEAADVAALAGTTSWTATLAATEAPDTAVINGVAAWTATLAATEASDTALINVAATHTATLAATEASDTALVNATGLNLATLAATEAPDTAVINGVAAWTATLAATEAADSAAIAVSVKPWLFAGVGSPIEISGVTAHTLTVPAGVIAGDLLIAVIASRIASGLPIALPTGGEWTIFGQFNNDNVLSTSSATATGLMAYMVRGASNPSNTTFTHPIAPDVAIGQIIAYRGENIFSPVHVGIYNTTATNTATATVGSLVTTLSDVLLVAAIAGGQEGDWSAFDAATDPANESSGTVDLTQHPTASTWLLRSNVNTTTGADVSLAIADAVKATPGGTGIFSAQTTIPAAHVFFVGAFKPTTPGTNGLLAATEAPDSALINATVSGVAGILSTIEAADTSVINVAVRWLATLAATEASDTAAINAAIVATGTLAATETADTAAININVVGAGLNGNLAAIEAADTALINATLSGVAGTIAATEAPDTAAINAALTWLATLAATEAADTAAINAAVRWLATLAATEASDTAVVNGGVVIGGTLAATEAADSAAIAATTRWLVTLAATEAADTALINVTARHTATLAATEAADTAAINVNVVGAGINANLAATEAPDTALINASVTGVAGVLAATEAADSALVNATTRWLATLAATEAPDIAAINGGAVATGTLAATEAADTATLSGLTRWLAVLAATELPDSAAILVSTKTTATLAATEAADTAAITGLGNVFGILAATEASDTALISSARINQVAGVIGRQSPVPDLIATDAAPIDLVARRSSTTDLIAGN